MLATRPPPAPAAHATGVGGGREKRKEGAPIMEFAVHFFSSCFIALPRKAGLAALWDAC
jgi:hypothetical protein